MAATLRSGYRPGNRRLHGHAGYGDERTCLQDALEKLGVPTGVQTAIAMNEVAEPFIRRRAERHLGAGSGGAACSWHREPLLHDRHGSRPRAVELHADVLLKATKVDGVYRTRPDAVSDARRYDTLSYTEALQREFEVMDGAAVQLCKENDLPIIVFNLAVAISSEL